MPLVTLVLLPAILRADARATVPIVQIGCCVRWRCSAAAAASDGGRRAHAGAAPRPAGEVLIREGEPGDLFYLVADGEVAVTTRPGS